MFSLESPHRGDSNEYIHHTIINQNITLKYPKYNNVGSCGFFLETQERVRNSRGKRIIGVRAIEVLLYEACFSACVVRAQRNKYIETVARIGQP